MTIYELITEIRRFLKQERNNLFIDYTDFNELGNEQVAIISRRTYEELLKLHEMLQ